MQSSVVALERDQICGIRTLRSILISQFPPSQTYLSVNRSISSKWGVWCAVDINTKEAVLSIKRMKTKVYQSQFGITLNTFSVRLLEEWTHFSFWFRDTIIFVLPAEYHGVMNWLVATNISK